MSLDVYLKANRLVNVHEGNITHNLNKMAKEAGLYEYLWRPEEVGITRSSQLIRPLKKGLNELKRHPEKYAKFNPDNGWGDYDGLVKFVEGYLNACINNKDATIEVSR